jgi:hypothetical protein
MPRKPSPPADNPEEFKRFLDMAREVEADEAPDAVDRAFKRVVSGKKPPPEPSRPKRGGRRV